MQTDIWESVSLGTVLISKLYTVNMQVCINDFLKYKRSDIDIDIPERERERGNKVAQIDQNVGFWDFDSLH